MSQLTWLSQTNCGWWRKTTYTFEFSVKSSIRIRYFSSCAKKKVKFCWPVLLAGIYYFHGHCQTFQEIPILQASKQASYVCMHENEKGNRGCCIDVLAKLRKVNIIFVVSVCLSVCPHGTTGLLVDGFSWNLVLGYFLENLSTKSKSH